MKASGPVRYRRVARALWGHYCESSALSILGFFQVILWHEYSPFHTSIGFSFHTIHKSQLQLLMFGGQREKLPSEPHVGKVTNGSQRVISDPPSVHVSSLLSPQITFDTVSTC